MRLSSLNLNFKGYDAAPLRSIRFSDYFGKPLILELKQIGAQEGIEIVTTQYAPQWYQDSEVILNSTPKNRLVARDIEQTKEHIFEIKKQDEFDAEFSPYYIKGGNVFLGKYPDGTKWMLTGDEEAYNKNLDEISELYGVEKENIHFIPNRNFHLDLFIRPVDYPYVLVNDEKLCLKYLNSMKSKKSDAREFRADFDKFYKGINKRYKSSVDDVCKKLESLGFIPIRVPGVWGYNINFMNAIVNKHDDNTISYIAGSSKCKSSYISQIQDIFEQELRTKAPNIRDIYFIEGEKDKKNIGYGNKLMQSLGGYSGGLHCMCLEEPNFEIWG